MIVVGRDCKEPEEVEEEVERRQIPREQKSDYEKSETENTLPTEVASQLKEQVERFVLCVFGFKARSVVLDIARRWRKWNKGSKICRNN